MSLVQHPCKTLGGFLMGRSNPRPGIKAPETCTPPSVSALPDSNKRSLLRFFSPGRLKSKTQQQKTCSYITYSATDRSIQILKYNTAPVIGLALYQGEVLALRSWVSEQNNHLSHLWVTDTLSRHDLELLDVELLRLLCQLGRCSQDYTSFCPLRSCLSDSAGTWLRPENPLPIEHRLHQLSTESETDSSRRAKAQCLTKEQILQYQACLQRTCPELYEGLFTQSNSWGKF